MYEKIRGFCYHWATVIAGVVVGGMTYVFQVLDSLGAIDLTPLLPPARALQIVTGVAVAKAIHAFYTRPA